MTRKTTLSALALGLATVIPVGAQAQKQPAALSVTAAPTTIVFGKSTVLSGKLAGPKASGKSVQVQSDPFPFEGDFGNVGAATTDAQGAYVSAAKPSVNTRFRTRQGKSLSPAVTVLVRIRASLRVSDSTPRRGRVVRFSGRACPQHDGAVVRIQRRKAGGGWRTVRRTTLRDIPGSSCSRYSKRMRIFRDGTYRATVARDADHATGISSRRRIDVRG